MYYTKMRKENEAYQHRVDSAWEQRERAEEMVRFTVNSEKSAKQYLEEQMALLKEEKQ